MKIVENFAGVGEKLTIYNGTYCYIKSNHDIMKSDFYQGNVKLKENIGEIIKLDDYLMLQYYDNDTKKHATYKYDGKTISVESDQLGVWCKIGDVFSAISAIPGKSFIRLLCNNNFEKIEVGNLEIKSLCYKNDAQFIYLYRDIRFGEKEKDSRHERLIECTDLNQEVIWEYTPDHLGFYIKRGGTLLESYADLASINKATLPDGAEILPITLNHASGKLSAAGVLVLYTNNNWLIGIDIETGKELWVVKEIPGTAHQLSFDKPDKASGEHVITYSFLKVDHERGVIYTFILCKYYEIDIRTGEILCVDNRTNEFEEVHKINYTPNFYKIDDIIYYASWITPEFETPKSHGYIIGYNVKKKEIVFEYPLKGKNKKETSYLSNCKYFEVIGNKFYVLDWGRTLWVFEDEHFYERHPSLLS